MADTNGQNGNGTNGNGKAIIPQASARTIQWEHNHTVIMDAYVTVASSKKRLPTITEVAEASGFNRDTVSDHFKRMELDPVLKGMRAHTELVLKGLTSRAASGRASEVELWFWLMWNMRRTLNVHHTGSIDINNVDTSKLSTDKLRRLALGEPIEMVLTEHKN
jgi:hypothetical protein